MPAQQSRCAQGHVTASDQENPDQFATPTRASAIHLKMTFEITIKPSDHSFACGPDETVLAAAMRADLMLPYGCRNGACGTCKGKVLAGEVDYGAHQKSTLTEDEKRVGYALFCCARPRSDVTIEVREVRRAGDIVIKRLPCRIESIEKAAPDVAIVRFKLPANERLQYLAGQYIDFLLKDGKRRSFSLATPPHDDKLLELHIRHVPNGSFTDALFTQYKGREILRFEGPLGSFYLREDSAKPIVLVAGGTGFAPIKAIVEHALHHRIERQMVLYWGARAMADLYLPHLPGRWQSENANFTYIPVLSEPRAEDCWPGRTGFVHQAVMQDFPDLSGYQVYACGAPPMIDAARRDFTQACGLPPDAFFADSFTYAAETEARP
jgi:CDP-4-dehydro-6-deoxyglucose reductase